MTDAVTVASTRAFISSGVIFESCEDEEGNVNAAERWVGDGDGVLLLDMRLSLSDGVSRRPACLKRRSGSSRRCC